MAAQIGWRGIAIEVRHDYEWLGTGWVHLEIEAVPRTPLPITETGYRSAFLSKDVLAEYADETEFVLEWLDDAAKNWNGQLTLL